MRFLAPPVGVGEDGMILKLLEGSLPYGIISPWVVKYLALLFIPLLLDVSVIKELVEFTDGIYCLASVWPIGSLYKLEFE